MKKVDKCVKMQGGGNSSKLSNWSVLAAVCCAAAIAPLAASAAEYVQGTTQEIVLMANTGDGTTNTLTDGALYSETAAVIYAKDDLTIKGATDDTAGTLTVTSGYQHGIHCNNDLKVNGGILKVRTEDGDGLTYGGGDGIRGKTSVEIKAGKIDVNASGDGVKSTKGTVTISGGETEVKAGNDAVQGETALDISGGTLDIAADEDGIHSGDELRIRGGDVRVTASTGLQAGLRDSGAGDILLSGGKLFVSAAKQGLKAEGEIYANNELLVLFNSEKQAGFAEGGQSWFRAPVSGSAGDTVTVASAWDDVEVPQSFKILLCSSADFAPGDQITVSVSGHSYPITIR